MANTYEIGKLTEKELVEKYGSTTQNTSYIKNHRLQTKTKNALLDKISRYCKVEQTGKGEFYISEVYKYPLPANFKKMNAGIYKYITPLLLDKILNGSDGNRHIDITLGKWAREINMVNHNYNLCKYNKEETSKVIECDVSAVNEFYKKSDTMIEYYIKNTLDYLKSAGLIIWREAYNITREVSDDKIVIDEDGTIHAKISLETTQATKEDMKYYAECIAVADKKAGIVNASERYYSSKSKKYNEVLSQELYKKKIKCVYKTYEAYYVNKYKCKAVLNQFNVENSNIIEEFNDTFTGLLVKNAEKRYEKNEKALGTNKKYTSFETIDEYAICFKGLCEMTIDAGTESLVDRITKKTLESNYKLKIE